MLSKVLSPAYSQRSRGNCEHSFPENFLLVLADGVSLRYVRGRAIVFVPDSQSLFEVDERVGSLWAECIGGLTARKFLQTAARHGFDGRPVLNDLLNTGILEYVASAAGPVDIHARLVLGLAGVRVGVAFSGDRSHHLALQSFGNLRISAAAHNHIVVLEERNRIGLAASGQTLDWGGWESFIPRLKIALTEIMLETVDGPFLHVSSLVAEGALLLLCGDPGAGKSTLSVALDLGGFGLVGDDIAVLHSSGHVQAIPFPATVKSGSWDCLGQLRPRVSESPTYLRPDKQLVRYLPLECPDVQTLPVRLVLLLDRGEREPGLTPLSVTETFAALLAGAWTTDTSLSPIAFEALCQLVDKARAFRLSYRDLDEGLRLTGKAWAESEGNRA